MTPAARVQTAIELLDLVIASAREGRAAADTVLAEGFRARRYAGSGDRRAIRDLVYRAIRRFGEVPPSGRAAMVALADGDAELAALFDGSARGPAVIRPDEPRAGGGAMPAWLSRMIGDDPALLARAPLDLRVNLARTTVAAVAAQFAGSEAIAHTSAGLRLSEPVVMEQTALWRDGLVDVQDAGSQIVADACRAAPAMNVIDLCAGGGGKTLALAAAMAGEGHLIATDTDRQRLSRLSPRAQRAGARVDIRLLDGGREAGQLAPLAGQADVVLVDAPCTGSGTLRRNPEARWRITPDRLDRALAQQAHVLDLAAPLVRPGGALVYAVCSLIEAEGAGQLDAFLARHPGFRPEVATDAGVTAGQGRLLHPARDRTDGFFVARLARAC